MSSSDHHCRYLAAFGTGTDTCSPFGHLLQEHQVKFPRGLPLRAFVERGWLTPVLRVGLPSQPFECWQNFPNCSMIGVASCPADQEWALDLFCLATTNPPATSAVVWKHCLDNKTDPLCIAARAHAIDPSDPALLPPTFRHAHRNQEVRPWIDYFAYWQVYQAAEVAEALRVEICPLILDEEAFVKSLEVQRSMCDQKIRRVCKKWNERAGVFEWISRIRTAFGSAVVGGVTWGAMRSELQSIFSQLELSVDAMRVGIRDVLLVQWREWTSEWSPLGRHQDSLLESLRQDIQYAVFALELVTGEPLDFLDPVWHYQVCSQRWARLIDALPLEDELARKEFPSYAAQYVQTTITLLPQLAPLDELTIRNLVDTHWRESSSLRRLVLAFGRLHRELHGEQLMENEKLVRRNERIEQFNLLLLHSERLLSEFARHRSGSKNYPEMNKLMADSLNFVACKLGLANHQVREAAREKARQTIRERAQLHNWDPQSGFPAVNPSDIASGDESMDVLASSFVNLVIGRNYAAHHDAADDELTVPWVPQGKRHPGEVLIVSTLIVLLAVLKVQEQHPRAA